LAKIVVKVGSNLLVKENGELDKSYIIELARILSTIKKEGNEIILVTSGARAAGYGKAIQERIDEDLYQKQALCAIGQVQLMKLYETAFDMYDERISQILINRNDFGDRKRFLNLRNTVIGLSEMGVIPLANENDTVATEEITFGDNDLLAAMFAIGWKSDMLLLLSSVKGVLDINGTIIERFDKARKIKRMTATSWGSGGIETKIRAARAASATGVRTCICDGRDVNNIERFYRGQDVGTTFAQSDKTKSKKAWIGFLSHTTGEIRINGGAKKAVKDKKSILPVGIVEINGQFDVGDVVTVKDTNGCSLGRGITNFSNTQALAIIGKKSETIRTTIDPNASKAFIHVDNFWLEE